MVLMCGTANRLAAQTNSPVVFDDYFVNKACRMEIYEIGDAKEELITQHAIYEEPIWPENPHSLIQRFEVGRYCFKVYDLASNKLIYSRESLIRCSPRIQDDAARVGRNQAVLRDRAAFSPVPKKPVKVVFENGGTNSTCRSAALFHECGPEGRAHIIRENVSMGDPGFRDPKNPAIRMRR